MMLYPNCSEWSTRIKILRLDDLTDEEKEVMYVLSRGRTDEFPWRGDYLDELSRVEYDYRDYYKLENALKKLPFWDKIEVEDGDN